MQNDDPYRYFSDRFPWIDDIYEYSMDVIREIKYMPFKLNNN